MCKINSSCLVVVGAITRDHRLEVVPIPPALAFRVIGRPIDDGVALKLPCGLQRNRN